MFLFRGGKKSRKSRQVASKRKFIRRLPLSLEMLEGRILLSADSWIGGSGNWDAGSNWSLGHAPGTGDTAIINTSSAATITIQSSDNINVQSVTTGSNDTLSIAGALTVTSGASTLSGALSMSGGSLGVTGSGVSLTANGTTTVADASFYAENGATLSLPQMTSYTADNNTFQASGTGSVLDVSALTTPTLKGAWAINAVNGGTLKLTGLTSLSNSSEGGVFINDTGGSTLLDSNVTTLNGVNATLDGSDTKVANTWTKFTNGQLSVTGGSYSLSGLTDVDGSNMFVSNGGSLTLPGLVSYSADNNTFQASGTGSVLDVSALTTPTLKGAWAINTFSGGTLKLTGLTSFTSGVYINDSGNSTLVDSNVTTLNGVNATLDGSDTTVANSWTKFTGSQLNVTGGSYNLAGLTDVDDSNLNVSRGGSLVLPGLTKYESNGTFFQSDGTGSVLDVSALTTLTQKNNWSINTTNGGSLKLTGMTALNGSNGGIFINDTGNSTLLDSNVTAISDATATLDGSDTKVANSWTKFTASQLNVTGGSYNLAGLTDVDDSNLNVSRGGSLALPGLTKYESNGTFFQADGSGSVLDVSKLTTVTQKNNWSITASNGGDVKLSSLANVTSTQGIYFNLNGSSSTIDLSALTSLTGPSNFTLSNGATLNLPVLTTGNVNLGNGSQITIQGTLISLPVDGTSGATINLPSSSGLTITLQNTGTLTNTTFNVGAGTMVALNGGTYLGTTTFNVGNGATADLTGGGSTNYGGTLTGSGSGNVVFSSGKVNPVVGGMTLNFPGSMFQWTGSFFFESVGDVTNMGTMNLAGPNDKGIAEDGTLFNLGTIIETGSGNFSLHSDNVSPAILNNEAGASFLIEGDGGFDNTSGGVVAVQNAGAIKKTGGTGTSTLYINGALSNTGVIEADSGTLLMNPHTYTQISGNTLTAGTWNAVNGASLLFGNTTAGEITTNAANVTISGSGADSNATFNLFNLSSNTGSFTIGNGFNDSQTADFTNSGSFTVGAGSTFTFGGNFTQAAAGTLNVQLGGTAASGQFGQVAVTGTATLGGALNVSLVDGFTPGAGQDFKVMTFASASGAFATVSGLGTALAEQLNPTSLDLQSTATSLVDLGLTSVTAPTTASTGQPITVNWQVSNSSSNAATGNWQDSVFLSTTPSITSRSVLLGSVTHTGGIAANGSYSASLTAALPALPPGNYYVLVQADSLYQVSVTSRANDIVAASTGQLAVSVPSLTLGTASNGTFTAANQDQYYQVTVPAGGSLQVSLTSAATSGALALYVSQGTQPTPYSYQEAANIANQPNQSLNVPVTAAGTYYILVHSVSGAAATAGYTLTVTQSSALNVSAISSYPGGNQGNVTIEIDGANFTPQTTASLTLGGSTINASAVYFMSASQLFATFNLKGAAVGGYALSVQQGTQSATAASKFQVIDAKPNDGVLWLTLGSGPQVRAGRSGTWVISYANKSNNDIVAPLLEVSSTNDDISFSTLDNPNYYVMSEQLLAVASSGPAGIIRPGQSGQIILNLLSEGTGGSKIPLSVKELAPTQTIQWDKMKDAAQPSSIPTAAWNVIWNNLLSTVGTTVGSYQGALSAAATYLSSLGESSDQVSDVARLWSLLIAQSDGSFPTSTFGSAIDASLPTPGKLPLSLERTYQSTISGRSTAGPFGLGWTTSWESSLSVDNTSGNVTINSGGSFASFIALPNGTYLNVAGEQGTLTKSGSGYTFTDRSGTQDVFLANGDLGYVQDTNGNRITLGYNTNNQLISLTYSNSADSSEPTQQLTLTYNSQGFVSQMSDGAGNTWTYSYDSAGHLLSVTAPGNLTTSYTYDTGSNPETANALLSIAKPDGSQFQFTYDSTTGRLSGVSQNGGVNSIAYTYPGESEVTATDATGGKSTIWFNDMGLAARAENALGGISTNLYDRNGNLIGYTDAAGDTYHYSYDTNGNLTQSVNPLGQSVQLTYGPLGTITSIADAAGNTTRYSYDAAGNLLTIAYPDGKQQSFTYDPLGNLSETVLRNGDAIGYQYNAQGLVGKATFADGSSQTYTYDATGNMLTASSYNSSGTLIGTTTLTYNAANELTSITYPNGQFLKFAYNAAGQRTQSVDQSGYTVNYTYDSLGRLSELADGSGNPIVQYTYNTVGQLVKKVNGNGTFTTYAYDAAGDLTQEINSASATTVNSSFTYTYNMLGEQTSVTDAAGNVTKYGYDALGQLTQVTMPDGTNITYVYNAAGDRTEVLIDGTPTNYSSNAVNQITQAGSATYTYDANGNLITATDGSGTTTYTYNDLNQLVSILSPDGSVQTFQYSPLGFLVGTSTTSGGSTSQTNYLVDPTGLSNVAASYDGSGSLIAHYNYGLGLTSQTGPSGTGYYDFDARGDTVGITGSSGSYVNQYSYQPFGVTTAISAALPNPFTFSGQYGVIQIGNLDYMRARFYDPSLGAFMSMDPGRILQPTLYSYASNDPISLIDPLGTYPSPYGDGGGSFTFGGAVGIGADVGVVWGPNGWGFTGGPVLGLGFDLALLGIQGGPTSEWSAGFNLSLLLAGFLPVNFGPFTGNPGLGIGLPGLTFGFSYTQPKPNPWPWAKKPDPNGKYTIPTSCPVHSGKKIVSNLAKSISVTLCPGNPPDPPPIVTCTNAKSPDDTGPSFNCSSDTCGGGSSCTSGSTTASHDPNALVGPAGKGPQGYILSSGALSYTVDFENDGKAAAQTVTTTEQLDPNLDWSTFQLGSFGFGSVKIVVPSGLTQYQTSVPYQNVDGTSLNVNVSLNFNVQTGLLAVSFASIDPLTGQAPNGVLDGFLPTDNSSGIGEGFVQYTVRPKSGLAAGATIGGQAAVVFDTNPAIQTNKLLNTIDATPPTSSVNPLPAAVHSTSFTVSWSGSDPSGPGIADYDVYVSDNGGAFAPWQLDTSQTSATYNGQKGHTYSFYSVAIDAVGLRQPTPTGAQASTTVSLLPPPPPPPPHSPPPPPISLSAALAEGIPTLIQGFSVVQELPQLLSTTPPSQTGGLISDAFSLLGEELSLLPDIIMGFEASLGIGASQAGALAEAIDAIVAEIHANPLYSRA